MLDSVKDISKKMLILLFRFFKLGSDLNSLM